MQVNFTKSTSRWKLIVVAFILSFILFSIHLSGPIAFDKTSRLKMGVTHIVLFQFKSSARPDEINDVCLLLLSPMNLTDR
jgi:hypothetical protein